MSYGFFNQECTSKTGGPWGIASQWDLSAYSFGPGSMDSNFVAFLDSSSAYFSSPNKGLWLSPDNQSTGDDWNGIRPVFNFSSDNVTYENAYGFFFGLCVASTDNSSNTDNSSY